VVYHTVPEEYVIDGLYYRTSPACKILWRNSSYCSPSYCLSRASPSSEEVKPPCLSLAPRIETDPDEEEKKREALQVAMIAVTAILAAILHTWLFKSDVGSCVTRGDSS